MRLAVCQAGLLEVAAAEEGLLAFGAGKVLHVPGTKSNLLSNGLSAEKSVDNSDK